MLTALQFRSSLVARLARVSTVALVSLSTAGLQGAEPMKPAAAVQGFLQAGEFGAAAQAAQQAPAAVQPQLLEQVAAAQMQTGDVFGAQLTLAQLAQSTGRVRQAEQPVGGNSAAGGVVADFTQLIDLIQEHTDAEWIDRDGVGGSIGQFDAGIRVDPQGLLVRSSKEEASGRLAALGVSSREAALHDDMARSSSMRMVSLTRLEREVAQRLAEGKPAVESMRQLAGLSQVQYLFVYPELGEIVIAGPAEGWKYDDQGMAVGAVSGRPTLHLDDLVTVLRTFDADGQRIFGCSIDPQPERLKQLREFAEASQTKGPLRPGEVKGWVKKLGETLGRQNITVYGVPANSRTARVLVEADYRMKLIGVGQLEGGPEVPDYFELLAKHPGLAPGGLDALRWWMTMNYSEVLHSAERDAFEIRGSSVLCQSENQFVTSEGQRVASGQAEPVNRAFAENFTRHFSDLAHREPIFADLQGIFDLALVAALIDQEQADVRTGWDRGVFASGGAYRPRSYATPKEVDTVVNHRVYRGRDVVVQVAGGVRGDLLSVVSDPGKQRTQPELENVALTAQAPALPEGRWWWDAASPVIAR